MVKRIRQHVNPLHVQFAEFRGAAPEAAGRPIDVEIGCAEAQFLFERAAGDPDRTYLGLEIRHELVDEVNRRAERQHLPVRAVFGHANPHLAELASPLNVRQFGYLALDARAAAP